MSSTCPHDAGLHPVGSGEHHNERLFALSTEITWIHFGNCLRSILRCDLKPCIHFPNVLLFLFRILINGISKYLLTWTRILETLLVRFFILLSMFYQSIPKLLNLYSKHHKICCLFFILYNIVPPRNFPNILHTGAKVFS